MNFETIKYYSYHLHFIIITINISSINNSIDRIINDE